MFFFFFQAEDGIRDGTVTGVQTCALPIYDGTVIVLVVGEMDGAAADLDAVLKRRFVDMMAIEALAAEGGNQGGMDVHDRSEERRVGKECRCRGVADQ